MSVSWTDRKAAFDFIEKARSITPDYTDIYKIAGFLYATFGEAQRADDEYNIALEMKPKSAGFYACTRAF